MAVSLLKRFWKEWLAVLALTLLFSVLIDAAAEPAALSKEFIYSPLAMLIGVTALLLPLAAALPGGYLIGRKTRELKPALLVPALAAALAGLLLLGAGILQIALASDAQIEAELEKLKGIGIGILEEMSVEEFRAFTVSSALAGMVFIVIVNAALGAAGGWIGRRAALGKRSVE